MDLNSPQYYKILESKTTRNNNAQAISIWYRHVTNITKAYLKIVIFFSFLFEALRSEF